MIGGLGQLGMWLCGFDGWNRAARMGTAGCDSCVLTMFQPGFDSLDGTAAI